jgi:ABC-type uncharacterized transport system ATPase subunit
VAVLFRGQVAGEMPVGDATEESLGLLMAGSSLDSNGPNARVAGADGE